MKTFINLLFTISIISCSPFEQHEPTMIEKQEVYNSLVYDQKIINDFPKYDTLAHVLLIHLDTIIKYKNCNNYVTVVGGNGKQSKQLRKENCYMFFNGNDNYDIRKIPQFLSSSVSRLWFLIDKPQIEICKEKRPASLIIKKIFKQRENRILECHFLYWNLNTSNNTDSFDLVKDTALTKNCIYRIGVTTYNSGW